MLILCSVCQCIAHSNFITSEQQRLGPQWFTYNTTRRQSHLAHQPNNTQHVRTTHRYTCTSMHRHVDGYMYHSRGHVAHTHQHIHNPYFTTIATSFSTRAGSVPLRLAFSLKYLTRLAMRMLCMRRDALTLVAGCVPVYFKSCKACTTCHQLAAPHDHRECNSNNSRTSLDVAGCCMFEAA